MSRVVKQVGFAGLMVGVSALLVLSSVQAGQVVDVPVIHLGESLQSRYDSVKDQGSLRKFPKGVVQGDLYEDAYAMAQLQVAKPALDALDLTHQYITQQCDGQLSQRDVSVVFAQTRVGGKYFKMLDEKGVVDEIEQGEFDNSCLELVRCYYNDLVEQGELDVDKASYSNTVVTVCKAVVDDLFNMMSLRTSSLETIKNINYGDEFFSNAKSEDGPYDLLLDIEAIGDLLFAHNDPASEIHFYDVEDVSNYVDNDPYEVTPHEVELPSVSSPDPVDRLPPSVGIPPGAPDVEPEQINPSFRPSDGPAQGVDTLNPDEQSRLGSRPGGGGFGSDPTDNSPASESLQNNLCQDFETDPSDPNPLELAEQQQEQTVTYNTKLELDDRLAWALLGKMLPEVEELYGIDGVIPPPPPDLSQQASEILEKIELDGESLEEMQAGFQQCVQQFSAQIGGDANVFQKMVWKSITQPTELTQCVHELMCKQLSDPSGKGIYRLEICKIPKRSYGVTANQPVYSIEEIIDEVSNVCTNLKESGQLIEHNETKDHRDHKLMRADFGEKISFALSIGFKPVRDEVDPAVEKRMQIENHRHLQRTLLDLDIDADNYLPLSQRNRYLLIQDPLTVDAKLQPGDRRVEEERARKYQEALETQLAREKEKLSQLTHYSSLLDEIDEFVKQNTSFWMTNNDYMSSLTDKREATFKKFKSDPGN